MQRKNCNTDACPSDAQGYPLGATIIAEQTKGDVDASSPNNDKEKQKKENRSKDLSLNTAKGCCRQRHRMGFH